MTPGRRFHYWHSTRGVERGDRVLYAGERFVVEEVLGAGTKLAADYSSFDTGSILIVSAGGNAIVLSDTEDEEDLEFLAPAENRTSHR